MFGVADEPACEAAADGGFVDVDHVLFVSGVGP